MKKLIIASRSSPLALKQVEEAVEAIKTVWGEDFQYEVLETQTLGDKDQQTPLTNKNITDDFFTREIDRALLGGEADLAVHSAKDLPQNMPKGLEIGALLPARDIRDALVLRKGVSKPLRIGTSSPQREKYMRKLFPNAKTIPIRGTIGERLKQLDRGQYDGIIVAACALQRLGLTNQISEYLEYNPTPQQGRLALVVSSHQKNLLNNLRTLDVRRKAGMAALVGCPADFALLSRKAEILLREAKVIFHDRLIPDEILSLYRDKVVSVGKIGHQPSIKQSEIHRKMLYEVEQGFLVVRLQGGDPGILGHLSETLQFLSDWNIRVDIVPAPSAAQVVSAKGFAALTQREGGRAVTFLSGRKINSFPSIPDPSQNNLAIYMGCAEIVEIQKILREKSWPDDTPVLVGKRLGYRDEELVYTFLKDLHEVEIQSPATLLIGPTAYPGTGYTLFTGTDAHAFLKQGPLLPFPLIKLEALPLKERLKPIKELSKWAGIIFPSRFAVRCFMEALMQHQDVRALHGKKILAVGPASAKELLSYGLRADLAPADFGGVSALSKMVGKSFSGVYFYPCSDQTPREKRIQNLDLSLDMHTFYKNLKCRYETLPSLPFKRVLFTSSSTVKAYFENFPDEKNSKRVWLAIGTSTHETLKEFGVLSETLPKVPG